MLQAAKIFLRPLGATCTVFLTFATQHIAYQRKKKTYECPMNFRRKVLKNKMVPQNIVVKSKREALCDSVVTD